LHPRVHHELRLRRQEGCLALCQALPKIYIYKFLAKLEFHPSNMSHRRQPSDRTVGNRLPNGVCHDFWNTGNCRFPNNCKYRHERLGQSASASRSTQQRAVDAPVAFRDSSNRIPPMNSSLPSVGEMNFGQVTLALNKFCSASGAFRTLSQVQIMINVLASITPESSKLVRNSRMYADDC
jgi:hypothetical protein